MCNFLEWLSEELITWMERNYCCLLKVTKMEEAILSRYCVRSGLTGIFVSRSEFCIYIVMLMTLALDEVGQVALTQQTTLSLV